MTAQPHRASQMVLAVKNLHASAGDVRDSRDTGSIRGSGRSLEEGMATHFSILAWRIPWTEKPDSLQSIGSQRVRHDRATQHSYIDTTLSHKNNTRTQIDFSMFIAQRSKDHSINSLSLTPPLAGSNLMLDDLGNQVPKASPDPRVCRQNVFHKTGPWCQKS